MILVYDIFGDEESPRVLRNVFKICKKYLTHIQKSVFEGNLTQLNYLKLQKELQKYIRKDKDSVIVFQSRNEKWLEKEFWGVDEEDATSRFF